ncbi:hypothetical protein OA93_08280 [Flavobacterium sp. KMS]|uniref:hypothetical protein n=1 Tax=Flavobacterium sp. KMS TaxID=1566023 RepID=UPI00057DE6A0|nr:hypothetical protein [Flavobacterium sp. KMS]KIA98870.1 hypothetical protein OA93_08280 [Flavobacterium sp. KMS]
MKSTIIQLLVIFAFALSSCNSEKKEKIKVNNIENTITIVNKSCFVKQKSLNKKDNDDFLYKYENETYEIKNNNEQAYDIVLNGKKYLSNLNLESANINFYYYKCENKKVFLIEGDDYYSSVFFVYIFENEDLYYLGDFDINQLNVEKSGVLKKDFKISFNNNEFIIDALVKDKLFKTFYLKQKKSIPQESQDSKLDLNGLWRLNCENSLTTFDISDKKGYLSLYSNNAIYINVDIIDIPNKKNEYYLRFKNTDSQKKYYKDDKNVIDDEISKTENIAKLILKDKTALLYWYGLHNVKTKKLDFVDDFIMLKENGGKNPIELTKCD